MQQFTNTYIGQLGFLACSMLTVLKKCVPLHKILHLLRSSLNQAVAGRQGVGMNSTQY